MKLPLWLHKEWSLRWNVTSPVDITLVCILKWFFYFCCCLLCFFSLFFHFLFLASFAPLFHWLPFSTLLSRLIIARDKSPHEAWYTHKGALILLLVTKVWIYSSSHEDSFHTSDSLGDNAAGNWNNEGFGPVAVWIELHNFTYSIFHSSFSSVCVCVILPIWFCFRCLTVFTNGVITFKFFPHISWKLPSKRSKAFLWKTDCLNSWNTSYMCLHLL